MKTLKTNRKIVLVIGIFATLFLATQVSQAQVKIGEDTTPVKGAVLDLSNSSSGYVGGLKLPNVSITSLTAIPTTFKESVTTTADKQALAGTIVYNTNTNASADIFPGFYYWDGTKWVKVITSVGVTGPLSVDNSTGNPSIKIDNGTISGQVLTWNGTKWEAAAAGSSTGWALSGNNVSDTNFLGTTNDKPLIFKVDNEKSGYIGTTDGNTAFGYHTFTTLTGENNTVFGNNAARHIMSGNNNTIIGGGEAGYYLTNAENNTFLGSDAGATSMGGNNNIAIGAQAHTPSSTESNQLSIGNWIYGRYNGNIGIGTSNPTEKLHIQGKIKIVDGTQGAGKILVSDANGVGTWTTTSENGKVIEGYDPIWVATDDEMTQIGLQTYGITSNYIATGAVTATKLNQMGATTNQVLTWNGSAWAPATNNAWLLGGNTNTAVQYIGTKSSHDLPFITANSEKMRLTTGGYLGIGSTSPMQKLHVEGNQYISGYLGIGVSPLSLLHIKGGSTSAIPSFDFEGVNNRPTIHFRRYNDSGRFTTDEALGIVDFHLGTYQSDEAASICAIYRGNGTSNAAALKFSSSGGNMFLDENGDVGIGTASPNYKLHVAGTLRGTQVYAGSTLLTSDVRYKKNISTISNPLSIIGQLKGTNYELRVDEFPQMGFSSGKQLGVIAQEVEKVLPELVSEDNEGYKSVNYDGIIPVLIEGIKAQQKIIEQLEARIRILEGNK